MYNHGFSTVSKMWENLLAAGYNPVPVVLIELPKPLTGLGRTPNCP